jgi:hypothetical protein
MKIVPPFAGRLLGGREESDHVSARDHAVLYSCTGVNHLASLHLSLVYIAHALALALRGIDCWLQAAERCITNGTRYTEYARRLGCKPSGSVAAMGALCGGGWRGGG